MSAPTGYATKPFGRNLSYNPTVSNLFNENYHPSSISMGDPISYRLNAEDRF
ncbi:hypothetical protein [Horticoccus sp. 23ND18S-11]|uniref:hypothetical protein n=1 Tax=Horticoccus sp. 23ND18S-11 TaxID=3391832 RepID=UPI0039C8FC6C